MLCVHHLFRLPLLALLSISLPPTSALALLLTHLAAPPVLGIPTQPNQPTIPPARRMWLSTWLASIATA